MYWDINIYKRLHPTGKRQPFELNIQFKSIVQRLVLFGPSGAGKSQTLRLLAGLNPPNQGYIRIAGDTFFDSQQKINLPPQRRKLGYVFQDYALFPHLNVQQNLAFGLYSGWKNPSRRPSTQKIWTWLEKFGLQKIAYHLPSAISGGQRQRTALARALIQQPTTLLLDEPFTALDKAIQTELREELLALQKELSIPMLIVTHDYDDVKALAEEVVTLDKGKVVSISSVF
jgi:molybdate transport system ATP-binding protein